MESGTAQLIIGKFSLLCLEVPHPNPVLLTQAQDLSVLSEVLAGSVQPMIQTKSCLNAAQEMRQSVHLMCMSSLLRFYDSWSQ